MKRLEEVRASRSTSRSAFVWGLAQAVTFGLALIFPSSICAQFTSPYVLLTGTLTSSTGLPAKNATLTLTPSFTPLLVAGSQVVVSAGQCATDASGALVGVGNPLAAPRVTPQFSGTLIPGNYYVRFTWYDQFGAQTLPSTEVAIQLTATGELQILPPVGTGPPQATGMNVFIGTNKGGETYQGQTTSLTAQYTQATALNTTSNAPPISNGTACRVVANDAAWPTGTGYQASLIDVSGNTLFNYAELWQFNGPGSTYNLSQGIPYYHGQVTYPVPVLTLPYNHNPQGIMSALSFNGYNAYNLGAVGVGTSLPAWGVDVEGTGADSQISATGGYLVGGAAPVAGVCLGSDGTAYDTPINVYAPLAATGSGVTVVNSGTTSTIGSSIFTTGAGVPSGGCVSPLYINTSATSVSTVLYACYGGSWSAVTVP